MHIVEKFDIVPKGLPQVFEELRGARKVGRGCEEVRAGKFRPGGRLVPDPAGSAVVSELSPYIPVSPLHEASDVLLYFDQVPPVGVSIAGDALPGSTSEELVEGHPGDLSLYVPEGEVYGTEGRHEDRPSPPVAPVVQ